MYIIHINDVGNLNRVFSMILFWSLKIDKTIQFSTPYMQWQCRQLTFWLSIGSCQLHSISSVRNELHLLSELIENSDGSLFLPQRRTIFTMHSQTIHYTHRTRTKSLENMVEWQQNNVENRFIIIYHIRDLLLTIMKLNISCASFSWWISLFVNSNGLALRYNNSRCTSYSRCFALFILYFMTCRRHSISKIVCSTSLRRLNHLSV